MRLHNQDAPDIVGPMGAHIAAIVTSTDDGAEERANARLIAAAPELLEAVTLLQAALTEYHLRDVKKRYSLCVADAAASAAIAKATGD